MTQLSVFLTDYRIVPVLAAPLAAIVILIIEQKALKVYLLAFQYVMIAWLTVHPLPLESSFAKLLAGLISVSILFFGTIRSLPDQGSTSASLAVPHGRVFRVIAVALVVVGTLGVSFESWMPIAALSGFVQQSAMTLIVLGLLGIGLNPNPLEVGISLITIVSGFEVIYSAVEPSLAIVALLALVHLGIALVISYFEIIGSGAYRKAPEQP